MIINFNNKTLLITGGTGSFGNAVLKSFLQTDVKEIRIFSRDELKQDDMRKKYNHPKLKFYLGDVRDINSVNEAMLGVDFVFHAAALKQVPSCEFYPMQAVQTNIIGTGNVLESACKNNVQKAVLLSTDKAVYPINSMGISKAMMEKLVVAKSRVLPFKQVFCITRYGNVMASRGSVIQLFVAQIKSNKPLTITEPKMTRFMMSLDDSVELVKFAFNNAKGGDIFVQKSPATTVEILAQALLEIFNASNQIKVIGTRHGEKLYETLLTKEEMHKAHDLGSYFRVPADNRDLNYDKYFAEGDVNKQPVDDYHSHNTEQLDIKGTKQLLLGLDFIKREIAQ